MKLNGKYYRSVWIDESDKEAVCIFDQRELPFKVVIKKLRTVEQAAIAIKDMHLRGAPLIGAVGAFSIYLAALEAKKNNVENFLSFIEDCADKIKKTRPTAVNLMWAVDFMIAKIRDMQNLDKVIAVSLEEAEKITAEDAEMSRQIGIHGAKLIREISKKKSGDTVNILTHCNAGWLATVDYGTALAPIYEAFNQGIKVHVWVDETRPRNQGARLTAFELSQQGVPHTLIADNTGGHLMQHEMVDMVIVGSDRTTRCGDVANKIGTYLKALAAKDNGIPFYAALPSSTFDWSLRDGVKEIPIEERDSDEVKYIEGYNGKKIVKVLLTNESSNALNYGFDVTPAKLVDGIITERGVCAANEKALMKMFPEFA